MSRTLRRIVGRAAAIGALLLLCVHTAGAQSSAFGRVAVYGDVIRLTRSDLSKETVGVWSAALTLHSASNMDGGFEYGLDFRGSRDFAGQRSVLQSLYDAYVGGRTSGGAVGFRVGQMWINELGSLGSVGGAYLDIQQRRATKIGRFRLGLFAGVEPKVQEVGYFTGIKKAGAFVALEGDQARRSVLGYVQVKNGKLLERSVAVMTNFIPIGQKFFLYQAGEYDITAPGGQGKSGLNYFFVNARWLPVRAIELQGIYHYGLSIDARTLTDDQIAGRPIDPRLLDGFLYESIGGRLSVNITPTLRVYGGYAQERRNKSEAAIARYSLGLYASNLFKTGFDFSVSDSRYHRTTGADDDALYVSIGRSIGSRVYITAEYSNSVAFLRFTDSGGVVIESRPALQRYALSTVANLNSSFSLLLTLEHLTGDTATDEEDRALVGLSYRF